MNAPIDEGVVLARCPRPDGELRLVLREYQGHPFLDLRLWWQDRGGRWLPSKKGTSIRRSELATITVALGQASASMLDGKAA